MQQNTQDVKSTIYYLGSLQCGLFYEYVLDLEVFAITRADCIGNS